MIDTMTGTKIVGGFCGAFLVFLLGNWAASAMYGLGETPHVEGEHAMQAYTIPVEGGGDHGAAEEQQVDFAALMDQANADAGANVFKKCGSCHKLDGSNGVGPHLNGVVGRPVASLGDYTYDDALKGLGGDWTPDRLQEFLANPKKYAPGTKMSFPGLPKIEDRANVIKYLETTSG